MVNRRFPSWMTQPASPVVQIAGAVTSPPTPIQGGTNTITTDTPTANVHPGTYGGPNSNAVVQVNAAGQVTVSDEVASAGSIATSARKWTTARNFTFTGQVTGGPVAVDGSADVSIPLTIARSTLLFAQTQTVTVANSVAETSLDGTGQGAKTLAANYLTAGRTIKISALGYHSASGNPTIQVKVKFGSTVVLDTGAQVTGNSSNAIWELRGFITCRSTGVGGTVAAEGFWEEGGGGVNQFGMVNTAPVSIDTTIPQAITVTVQWGAAASGNTISAAILTIEGNAPV